MRLGYFGGSFDPPHLGHLAVACAAADRFALDRVLLTPTARQPLKPAGASADYAARLAMVERLCQLDPRLEACTLEAPQPDGQPNFTIDTLEQLAQAEPETQLFVLVGADAFRELPRWRAPRRLLALAQWIVVARPSLTAAAGHTDLLPPLTPAERARVHLLDTLDHPAAATRIRELLAQGSDCAGLLPPSVLDYIRAHHLYAA